MFMAGLASWLEVAGCTDCVSGACNAWGLGIIPSSGTKASTKALTTKE
jgi:hypothetical protein